jgi:hypothetical protein
VTRASGHLLRVVLPDPVARVRLTIRRPALTVTQALALRTRQGKAGRLTFTVTVWDSQGAQTSLRLRLVPH